MVPIIIGIFLLSCLIIFVIIVENKRSKTWETAAEGVYSHVVYGKYDYTTRSGAMVHHTNHHTMKLTVIYFTDGRTLVMKGRYNMEHPTGTKLRIWRNGNDDYRLEKVEADETKNS